MRGEEGGYAGGGGGGWRSLSKIKSRPLRKYLATKTSQGKITTYLPSSTHYGSSNNDKRTKGHGSLT